MIRRIYFGRLYAVFQRGLEQLFNKYILFHLHFLLSGRPR